MNGETLILQVETAEVTQFLGRLTRAFRSRSVFAGNTITLSPESLNVRKATPEI